MMTGWQAIDGEWYYLDTEGRMATNTWIGDYYLTGNGSMAVNQWIGNYYVGSDGLWIPEYSISIEERNALKKANEYLEIIAFSRSGLIGQLQYEGFSLKASTYAVDNCGANWYDQAARKAQSYLEILSFSRKELIAQLIFDGFTQEQAEYGVSSVGY